MEQNTDRMWWTIGAVVLGGVLIAGAILLLSSNLLPGVTTKITELFKQVPTITTTVTKP